MRKLDEPAHGEQIGQEDMQMGEILAVGITHYPPLAGRDESMSWILKRMLQNPHLPKEYRQAEGWPEAMRKEWSNDEGTGAARDHRALLLQALRRTRERIDEFQPDLIVIWGDDQYENFREDVVRRIASTRTNRSNSGRLRIIFGMSRPIRSFAKPATWQQLNTLRAA
jgi:hypothetical protein